MTESSIAWPGEGGVCSPGKGERGVACRVPRRACARSVAGAVMALLAAAACLCLPGVAAAQGKPAELKLSLAQSPAFPLGKAAERWAAALTEAGGGAFEVRLHSGAVLAGRDPLREFSALRGGGADLAVGSALMWSSELPAFGVYALPWLAPEPGQQVALAASADVRDKVAASAALADVIVVGIAPLGERVLATTKGPLATPAEVAGLRVRAVAQPLVIETLAALGLRPASMSAADAQAAFASGALDGQDAPATTLAATRITALGQRYVLRWGAQADVMVFAVRRAVWNGWDEKLRERARSAAADAAREANALAREDEALAALQKQGITIVQPAPAQRAAFRAAVQPVWTKWTSAVGAELVQAAEAAVAAAPAK
ncbi:MAG: TRAP transporter substrate-binding protein DctP [Burkholderiales bacterium]